MDKKTDELQKEYVAKMQECVDDWDTESAHQDADELLCKFLAELGFDELVEKYNEVSKWYT